jgi:mRNA-degrading endonuclease toxin of MazEF toxin-antitoxin module
VIEIHQGQVYWLDFGPAVGSALAERHPCVVDKTELVECVGILSSASIEAVRSGLRMLFDRL